jgi:hypothetical protein
MSDPAEEVTVLRELVDEEEQELGAAVRDLAGAARRSLEPVNWIRENPIPWLAGAVLCGFWIGRRSHRRERGWR